MTQWQPIETAPRDGTQVLAFVPRKGDRGYLMGIVVLRYTDEWSEWVMPGISGLRPAHWIPLPKEPEQTWIY